jgi:quercetin dioxygenase-like cupin family protein
MRRPPEPADTPALDSELVDSLCTALRPEPVNTALAQRVKRRVLHGIAAQQQGHLTVHGADGHWQPFGDGVRIKVLNEEGGVMSYLLQLAPGARVAAHRHPHDEECVVLEGTLMIGDALVVSAGGFHLARRGALHDTLSTVSGATIFLRGAAPEMAQLI